MVNIPSELSHLLSQGLIFLPVMFFPHEARAVSEAGGGRGGVWLTLPQSKPAASMQLKVLRVRGEQIPNKQTTKKKPSFNLQVFRKAKVS